jgi:long-chain acyl-CoA synthetase
MTFSTLPDRRAGADPGAAAVADSTQTLTNQELLERVRSVAAQLTQHGIGTADVVAARLTNRVEFVILMFAAWRIGATITPVNPALTPGEVSRQLDDSHARLLVTEDGSETIPGIASIVVSELRYDLAPQDDAGSQGVVVDPEALALLIYTSGTTGVPKGVMLDHANLDAMAEMGCAGLQLGATDRCLLILPLFHVNGIVVSVLCPLLAGASVVIAERFNPSTFFETVERVRHTFFSAVPTIYSMLAALPEQIQPDTSSIRFGVCGAAPASAELLARFETRYGFPLVEGYGLSEATCGSTINPVDGLRKAGTVGLPFPGQELRIVNTEGTPLPRGEVGEVMVSGPNVMRGYLGRPEETAAVITDGWLRTGDVGSWTRTDTSPSSDGRRR